MKEKKETEKRNNECNFKSKSVKKKSLIGFDFVLHVNDGILAQ